MRIATIVIALVIGYSVTASATPGIVLGPKGSGIATWRAPSANKPVYYQLSKITGNNGAGALLGFTAKDLRKQPYTPSFVGGRRVK